MTDEQLIKGKELKTIIKDYKNRIEAIDISLYINNTIYEWGINIGVKDTNGSYTTTNFTGSMSVDPAIKGAVQEEVLMCTERIKRIFDKEIAKLQQEFDNL